MTESARPLAAQRLRVLLPAGLFLIALLLRLAGIGWGLKNDLHNQSYHPDELDIWTYSQQIEPTQGKFTPGFYNYGTLYLTVLKVSSDVVAGYTGGPSDKDPDATWSYVSRCHLAGRIVNALAGAGTVLLVFLALRRRIGDLGAAMAAVVILGAPGHVVHSRFQTVDVFAVFLLAASAFFALKLIPQEGESPDPKRELRYIALAGLFAGLSAGTKYTGALGVLTVLVVILACRRSTWLRDSAIAIGASLLAFVIATPGAILDNQRFMAGLTYEMKHTATGHGIVFEGTSPGFVFHIGNLMSGIGAIVVALGLIGLLFAAIRRHVWAWALLAFFLPYYIVIGRAEAKFLRYTFPLYIGVAAGFGYLMATAHRRGGPARMLVVVGILGLGGIDSRGLAGAARETAWMLGEDPRDAAARYLKQVSKPETVVGLPSDPWFWTPAIVKDGILPRTQPLPKRLEAMAQATQPRAVYFVPAGEPPHNFDPRLLTEVKPDFVSLSSFETVPPERLQGRTDVSHDAQTIAIQYKQFTDALKLSYDPDRQFGEIGDTVEDMMYTHPAIYLWKRK